MRRASARESPCQTPQVGRQRGTGGSPTTTHKPPTPPHHHHQNQPFCSLRYLFCVAICGTLAVAMSDRDGGPPRGGGGSDGCVRCFGAERQTVAMELAAALHHSRDAGLGTYDGLRAQATASSWKRPGVLTEPEAQVGAVTVGCVAAPAPLLVVPLMAGGDGVDGTTARWLLKVALRKRQEQEERRRKEWEEEDRNVRALSVRSVLDTPPLCRRGRERRGGRKRCRNPLLHSPLVCGYGDVGKDALSFSVVRSLCRTCRFPWSSLSLTCPWCATTGRRYSCRDAEAVSHDPAVQQIIEIPQLLFDKVIDVRSPLSFTRPLCATTGTGGTAESPQLQLIDKVHHPLPPPLPSPPPPNPPLPPSQPDSPPVEANDDFQCQFSPSCNFSKVV